MSQRQPDRSEPGLTVIESPDLVAATAALLDDLEAQAPGPFDRPTIMVPHPVVWRYITLSLAHRSGAAASIDFPPPLGLLARLHGAPDPDPWSATALAWRIASLLPELAEDLPAGIARIAADPSPMARIDFGRRLARRLHRTMLHRPDLVANWEGDRRTDADVWQAQLWRILVSAEDTPSPIARHLAWRETVTAGGPLTKSVPDALLLISDATLPPLLREAIAVISHRIPVRWHLLNQAGDNAESVAGRRGAALSAVRALTGHRESRDRDHPLAGHSTLLNALEARLQALVGSAGDGRAVRAEASGPAAEPEVLGREVAVLVDGSIESGRYEAAFDGTGLPSGVYLVRLVTGPHVATQPITVLR